MKLRTAELLTRDGVVFEGDRCGASGAVAESPISCVKFGGVWKNTREMSSQILLQDKGR
jgi:hypothetical protein